MNPRVTKKEIVYVGFYNPPDSGERRVFSMTAVNKMDYICGAINRAGYSVRLVSPSWLDGSVPDLGYKPQITRQLNRQKRITLCPSFATRSKWSRNLKIIFTLVWLFFWLVIHVSRREKILVYHVQWLSGPLRWAKKIKRFKIVLEVEEIYGKVWKNKNILDKWEQKLIQAAHYFFVPSDILAETLGSKVRAVIYGDYTALPAHSLPAGAREIHMVYAGSIDNVKSGAINSVRCLEFLPRTHVVHILGSGNEQATNILKNEIIKTNEKLGREACIYHGFKTGAEFDGIMSSFSVGLNPQTGGDYMRTAFPSKIVKYLSYNLKIVSTPVESVRRSPIAPMVTFSENDTPESFAAAVLKLDLNSKYDGHKILRELDTNFVLAIKGLFKND